MVMVDSSIWIEATRRNGSKEAKLGINGLLVEYKASFCSPIALEVLGGARREERNKLVEYFSVLPYVAAREEDWQAARHNGWILRDNGVTAPWNDILIATISIRMESRVYVQDRHFEKMTEHLDGLDLYSPGYGGTYVPR
jgi:predicted nucleic acid-binding protein